MRDLAPVALEILAELQTVNKEIVQLCGPMSTGGFRDLDANMKIFETCIEIALRNGLFVFNQVPFQTAMIRIIKTLPPMEYCQPVLDDFYLPIFESGHIKKGTRKNGTSRH